MSLIFIRMNMDFQSVVAILTVCLFLHLPICAQQKISLHEAIELGLKNNLTLKADKLNQLIAIQQKAKAFQIDPTTIGFEYGQFNSVYKDTRFVISQVLPFPTLLMAQKKLSDAEISAANSSVEYKKKQFMKQISTTFYAYLLMQEKIKLLNSSDSMYALLIEKANIRYAAGESNVLEKTSAEMQQLSVRFQLNQFQQELKNLNLQFQTLLHAEQVHEPTGAFQYTSSFDNDSFSVEKHPLVANALQQIRMKNALIGLEKSKFLPNFFLTYNNTSIRGVGSDEKYYSTSTRFQSLQIGLGIPLFFHGQKANFKATKTAYLLAQNDHDVQVEQAQNEWAKAQQQYQQAKTYVQQFETQFERNYKQLLNVGLQQFGSGEINFFQYTTLMNQAIQFKLDYLNSVDYYNKSSIELSYLLGFFETSMSIK